MCSLGPNMGHIFEDKTINVVVAAVVHGIQIYPNTDVIFVNAFFFFSYLKCLLFLLNVTRNLVQVFFFCYSNFVAHILLFFAAAHLMLSFLLLCALFACVCVCVAFLPKGEWILCHYSCTGITKPVKCHLLKFPSLSNTRRLSLLIWLFVPPRCMIVVLFHGCSFSDFPCVSLFSSLFAPLWLSRFGFCLWFAMNIKRWIVLVVVCASLVERNKKN